MADDVFGFGRPWEARKGRPPKFETPQDLWEACVDYFDWVANNPLKAPTITRTKNETKLKATPKLRAMSIGGLCVFLNITQETWCQMRKKPGFSETASRVDDIIRQQKFEGASAELLNPNIIARDLGLTDKHQHEVRSQNSTVVSQVTQDMTPEEAAEAYERAIRD